MNREATTADLPLLPSAPLRPGAARAVLAAALLLVPPLALSGERAEAAPAAGARPRVAVLAFKDKTSRYSWYQGGQAVQDMFVTELAKTGKYRVIDREQLAALMAEKNLSLSGDIDPKTAVRAGKMLGVEYFVTGSLTQLSASERRSSAPGFRGFPGFNVRSEEMEAAVDARAISTTTGEIVWTDSEKDTSSDASVYVAGAGGGVSDRGKLDRVLRPVVQKLAKSLGETKLETSGLGGAADASGVAGKIAKVDGATVFVNVGSEAGVQVGDEFDVYRVGDVIKDPDTGEVLGTNETKVGRVRITAVRGPRLSTAAVTDGSGFKAGDELKTR